MVADLEKALGLPVQTTIALKYVKLMEEEKKKNLAAAKFLQVLKTSKPTDGDT